MIKVQITTTSYSYLHTPKTQIFVLELPQKGFNKALNLELDKLEYQRNINIKNGKIYRMDILNEVIQ